MNISIVVQGAFLIGDSIGNDAIFQFRLLQQLFDKFDISIFAETYSQVVYPDVNFTPMTELSAWIDKNPMETILYHFCDGWGEFEDIFLAYKGRRIIRWHNNTPPWFYADYPSALNSTLRGYRSIIRLASVNDIDIWANSDFSVRQLQVLCQRNERIYSVFPVSKYIISAPQPIRHRSAHHTTPNLKLLFVSRVVAHKGHQHVVSVGDLIARARQRNVVIDFVGRRDKGAVRFNQSVLNLVEQAKCEVEFHGGVASDELDGFYDRADVFVCLSEHEGFGLPVFEAMQHRIPVVAWANSAYSDLLRDHPLAFSKFDLSRFAAAVEIAATPSFLDAILRLQDVILSQYSEQIVRSQISQALGLTGTLKSFDVTASESQEVIDLKAWIAAAIEKKVDDYRQIVKDSVLKMGSTDFDGNYVSLYDIEAFEYLSNKNAVRQLSSPTEREPSSQSSQSGIFLDAEYFASHFGAAANGEIHFGVQTASHCHLIYGPYLDVPKGRFRFTLHFDFSALDTQSAPIIEVAANSRILASRRAILEGSSLRAQVECEFGHPEDRVEVRLWIEDEAVFSGVFKGISIERLVSITELSFMDSTDAVAGPDGERAHATSMTLHPRSFSTDFGRLKGDKLEIEISKPQGQYVFHGPYFFIPKGRFRFSFDLHFAEIADKTSDFNLDIADAGDVLLHKAIDPTDQTTFVVDCDFVRDFRRCELRLSVRSACDVKLDFGGVRVERLLSVVNLPVKYQVYTPEGVKTYLGEPNSVYLEPGRFTSNFGQVSEGRITFDVTDVYKSHLFHGPYITLPVGRFRCAFHFKFVDLDADQIVRLELANAGRILGERAIAATELNRGVYLECELYRIVDHAEFRLYVHGPMKIVGHFLGITIERISSVADLAGSDPERYPGLALTRLLKRFIERHRGRFGSVQ